MISTVMVDVQLLELIAIILTGNDVVVDVKVRASYFLHYILNLKVYGLTNMDIGESMGVNCHANNTPKSARNLIAEIRCII